MSDLTQAFVQHLLALRERDRGALAALRRSLGFAPGTFVEAMPVVERFVARDHPRDAWRQSLYLTAGLFASNPRHRSGASIGKALAEHARARDSASVERRFIALLAADPEALPTHLRHTMQLLAADERAIDYEALLADLAVLLDEWAAERRDGVRQRWARDFYREQQPAAARPDTAADTASEPTDE